MLMYVKDIAVSECPYVSNIEPGIFEPKRRLGNTAKDMLKSATRIGRFCF